MIYIMMGVLWAVWTMFMFGIVWGGMFETEYSVIFYMGMAQLFCWAIYTIVLASIFTKHYYIIKEELFKAFKPNPPKKK